jgi:hypothetical protein
VTLQVVSMEELKLEVLLEPERTGETVAKASKRFERELANDRALRRDHLVVVQPPRRRKIDCTQLKLAGGERVWGSKLIDEQRQARVDGAPRMDEYPKTPSSCRWALSPRGEQLPVSLGDDFDGAVGHLLWLSHRQSHTPVLLSRRPIFLRRPWSCLEGPRDPGAGTSKIHHFQRSIATGGRLPDEVLPDVGGHHHAPGTNHRSS